MKLISKIKLQTTLEQKNVLRKTVIEYNSACNYASQIAWNEKVFRQFNLHKLVYYPIRENFQLTAQAVVRCISKVADSYKLNNKVEKKFKELGSITYDDRIITFHLNESIVSIWSIEGRLKIPFICGERHRSLLQFRRGESDLVMIDDQFYLFVTCDIDEAKPIDVEEFLGIDLGIKNIASDSDGDTFTGNHLNNLRKRHSKLRKKLQKKGTKASRRLLKKRKRKESRMRNHVNHAISKKIVEKAKGTHRGIALENLKGIRDRITVRKAQRQQHHSWSFADLRTKIEYKAKLYGVPIVIVDPRNTSRTCQICGCIDKTNRKTQEQFLCVSCGFASNADTNAAVIISRRAAINQPYFSTT